MFTTVDGCEILHQLPVDPMIHRVSTFQPSGAAGFRNHPQYSQSRLVNGVYDWFYHVMTTNQWFHRLKLSKAGIGSGWVPARSPRRKKNVFFASQNGRCQTSEMSIFQKVRDENSKFSGHETQKTKLRILPCSLRCSSNIKSQEVITLQWGSVKDTATLY